ncbi:MAG: hypothetical protein QGH38_00280 [Candidatus Thalassarchaeaceae archaeon]|jgi:hypothetical protein|nr:hypothetical protein [Candidatus Thalassarchaeaceae archaeon]MEE2629535.1 hypothetical protein [Candidatus Thermoplasmatota archaeon]
MSDEFIYLGMNIPTFTKVVAAVLAFIGAATYFMTGQESITALIPSFVSIPMYILATLAEQNPEKRALLMHFAVLLGVFCIAGGSMGVSGFADGDTSASVIEQLLMMLVGVVYTYVCVLSFIHARKSRLEE